MKDARLYARIALDFADHAKIMPLSDAAFRCLIEATLWSRKHMTDGFLSKRLATARWSLEALRELCTNDDINPSLIEREDGWLIHDFALHQETKAEIEARTASRKAAGQKGGLARQAKAKQQLKQMPSNSSSKTQANSSRDRDIDIEVTTDVVTSRPRKRGTRLEDGWMPTQSTIDAVKTECPNVDLKAQHRRFIDYWIAQPGQKGVKADWDATWRNWMRRAAETTPDKPHKLRALADLAAQVRETETLNGKELQA